MCSDRTPVFHRQPILKMLKSGQCSQKIRTGFVANLDDQLMFLGQPLTKMANNELSIAQISQQQNAQCAEAKKRLPLSRSG